MKKTYKSHKNTSKTQNFIQGKFPFPINRIEQEDLKEMKPESSLVNSAQRKNLGAGALRGISGNVMAKPSLTLEKISVASC